MLKNILKDTVIFMSVIFVMLILPNKVNAWGLPTTPVFDSNSTITAYNTLLSTTSGYGSGFQATEQMKSLVSSKVWETLGYTYYYVACSTSYSCDMWLFNDISKISVNSATIASSPVTPLTTTILASVDSPIYRIHFYQSTRTDTPVYSSSNPNSYFVGNSISFWRSGNVPLYFANPSTLNNTFKIMNDSTPIYYNVGDLVATPNASGVYSMNTTSPIVPLIYNRTFSSIDLPDLSSIRFNVFNYGILDEYKFKIVLSSNDLSVENIPNLISSNGFLTDINDKVIDDLSFNDYFDISYTCSFAFVGDTENTCIGSIINKGVTPNSKIIGFYVDFNLDNLSNYKIDVFDSKDDFITWSSISKDFVGYQKYYFPSGMNKAIIRAKTFNNLTTSLIIPRIFETDETYNLKLFNFDFVNYSLVSFNNGSGFTNFRDDYYIYALNTDETNKIFPLVYNTNNSENTYFYLKNDAFVEFFNSDTFLTSIQGIDDTLYSNNNNLVLNGDLNTSIDEYVTGISSLDSNFQSYGLVDIVKVPFNHLHNMTISSCTDITLPIPFLEKNLVLPCFTSFYQSVLGYSFPLYQKTIFAFVSYAIYVNLFGYIKRFQAPKVNEIEVVDL